MVHHFKRTKHQPDVENVSWEIIMELLDALYKLKAKYIKQLKSCTKETLELRDKRVKQSQMQQMTSDYQMGSLLGQRKCLLQGIKEVEKLIAIL